MSLLRGAACLLALPALAGAASGVVSLDGSWVYAYDLGVEVAAAGFDDSLFQPVHIPHNLRDFSDEPVGSGRTLWFRRSFPAPEIRPGQRAVLRVLNAPEPKIWINGRLVAEGAPDSFFLDADVSGFLQPGRNLIAMRTRVPGVQGGVRLHILDPVHFETDGVQLDTPGWQGGATALRLRTAIENESAVPAECKIGLRVTGPGGRLLAEASSTLSAPVGRTDVELLTPPIADPPLWSPASPQLSTVSVTLRTGGTETEFHEIAYGFKWFRFDAEKGFSLNGKPLKLRGVVYTTPGPGKFPDRESLWRYEIDLLKGMGVNFIRPTPGMDDTFFAHCDRAGILVTARVHDYGDKKQLWENMRRDVRQKYNHASLLTWNVVGEGAWAGRAEFHSESARALMAHDSSHPVQCNELGWRSPGTVGLIDVDIAGNGNYTGWYEGTLDHIGPYMDTYRNLVRERYGRVVPILVSNYGAASDPEIHTSQPRRNDYSEEYHTEFHKRWYRELEAREWMSGGLIFCYRDIDGGQAFRRHTWKGVLDLSDRKKDAYYFYQSKWTDELMVRIAGQRWARRDVWPPGEPRRIDIFSNADEVELFHQGESLGRGSSFEVALDSGENSLRAVAARGTAKVADTAGIVVRHRPPPPEVRLVPRNDRVLLAWQPILAVERYEVFEGREADFEPADPNRIGSTAATSYTATPESYGRYYRVVAVSGNARSDPSAPVGWGPAALQWRFAQDGWLIGSPLLADLDGDGLREVVVGSYSGELFALSSGGELLWRFSAGDGKTILSSPLFLEGDEPRIVFASNEALFALSTDGEILWKREGIQTFDRNPKAPAAGDLTGDGVPEIVVASDTGELRAFNASGAELWSYSTAGERNRGLQLTTPAIVGLEPGTAVLFAADNGFTYLLDAGGNLVWKRDNELGDSVPGHPPVQMWPAAGALTAAGPVRIVSGAGHLKVWDAEGGLVWEREDLRGPVQITSLFPGRDRHIVTYNRNLLTVVDSRGRDAWTFDLGGRRDFFTQPLVGADLNGDGETDLVGGTRGTFLYAISSRGTVEWKFPTGDEVSATPAVGDINNDGYIDVVFGSRDGYIRMIGAGKAGLASAMSHEYRGGPRRAASFGE